MAEYVFKGGGNREISFSAGNDMAAWAYAREHFSGNRVYPSRAETLYRVDRVPVERPEKDLLDRYQRSMEFANNITTNK